MSRIPSAAADIASSTEPIAPTAPTEPIAPIARTDRPLFVDLDGTLIAGDVTQESVLAAIRRDPLILLRLPGLLLKGRATMKRALAHQVRPDVRVLPYRQELLDFIRQERLAGRRVVLATASDRMYAEPIADAVDVFDDVLASDGHTNLKGANKLVAIQEYCRQHGYSEFAYAGDALADVPIWRAAAEVHLVAPAPFVRRAAEQLGKPLHVHVPRPGIAGAMWRALRPIQWVKNVLLFVPLLLAHEAGNAQKLLACCLAFVAFSACASAVYVLNDLMDIEADRHHPIKRKRPFASGALPIFCGPLLVVACITFGATLSWLFLPGAFAAYLGVYLVVNCLYSFWLKQKLVLDVLLLAGMYVLRIIIGGVAVDLVVSEWLMALSMFLFTSLAFAKRHAELARLSEEDQRSARGRGYRVEDLSIIETVGPTSGYLAVLVLALYINSENATMQRLYDHPWALWLICPLLMYWITRLWFAVKRRELDEDPILYALRDRAGIVVAIVVLGLAIVASKF
jgi:4-hydroxybenzoate polyprenyltransferase/phosphoserine phosphatase